MRQCRKCGQFHSGQNGCPRCGPGGGDEPSRKGAVSAKTGEEWAVVARFANAAEAGYFANELDYALGVEPRLDCRDDFDAIQERWRSGFALSVPEAVADRARSVLHDLLDSDSSTDAASDGVTSDHSIPASFDGCEEEAEPPKSAASQIKWGPVLLTLAAGSLVIWHGKKLAPQRQPADPRNAMRIPLRDAPGLSDSTWIQSPGGGVRRELAFPADGQPARLREDRNGDGVYEREYSISIDK